MPTWRNVILRIWNMLLSGQRRSDYAIVGRTCDPNTSEMEAEESGIQDHLQPSAKFEASLGYMRSCLKKEDC